MSFGMVIASLLADQNQVIIIGEFKFKEELIGVGKQFYDKTNFCFICIFHDPVPRSCPGKVTSGS